MSEHARLLAPDRGASPIAGTDLRQDTPHRASAAERVFAASLHALQWDTPRAHAYSKHVDLDVDALESGAAGSADFVLYPQRWVMLALFCAFSASNAMEWLTYAPIADMCQLYYGVSSLAIQSLSMTFLLVYVALAFAASRWMARRGLRAGLMLGAGLNVAGALMKLLPWPFAYAYEESSGGYTWALMGTFLCALAQLFTLCGPVLLAQNWFGANERVLATALGTTANALGGALAFALAPMVLGSHATEVGEDAKLAQAVPLHYYLFVQLLLVTAAAFALHRWFQERPPSPPSFSAASRLAPLVVSAAHLSSGLPSSTPASPAMGMGMGAAYMHDSVEVGSGGDPAKVAPLGDIRELLSLLPTLMEDRAFRLVLLTFAVLEGFSYTLLSLLSSLLQGTHVHISSGFVGTCGVLAICSGVGATNLAAAVADARPEWRHHKKRFVWVALAVGSADMVLFAALPALTQANESGHRKTVLRLAPLAD